MGEIHEIENQGFRMKVNCANVVLRFSKEESSDIKGKVRDILVEAYEERFQKLICKNPYPTVSN